jgi:hypothetical protein
VYMPISFDMAVLAVMGGPETVETNSSVSIGTRCDACDVSGVVVGDVISDARGLQDHAQLVRKCQLNLVDCISRSTRVHSCVLGRQCEYQARRR